MNIRKSTCTAHAGKLLRPMIVAMLVAIVCSPGFCQEQSAEDKQAELLAKRDELDEQAYGSYIADEWEEGLKAARDALELERQALGDRDPQVIESLGEMAITVLELDGVEAAREMTDQWLKLSQEVHGPKDWRTGDAQRTLEFINQFAALSQEEQAELAALDKRSFLQYSREKHRRAIKSTQELVDRVKAVTGEKSFVVADCYEQIAYSHAALGNADQAVAFGKQVLAIRTEVLGLEHPLTADILAELAWLYHDQGDLKQAAELFQQALVILRSLFGIDDEDYVSALDGLATIYVEGHRDKQTIPILKAAVVLYQSLDEDEQLAAASSALAKELNGRQKLKEAITYFQTAAEAFERIDNQVQAAWMWDWTAACYRDLSDPASSAEAYAEAARRFETLEHAKGLALNTHYLSVQLLLAGRKEEALKKHEAAMVFLRRIYADDDPKLLGKVRSFAEKLVSVGSISEGSAILNEFLAALDRIHPGDHSGKLKILSDIGASLTVEGRVSEAVEQYRRTVAMARRLHSGDHDEVVEQLSGLGQSQYVAGDYSASLIHYQEALAMNQRLHAGDHNVTAETCKSLGMALASLGRYTEALQQYQIALPMFRRLYGDRHSDIRDTMVSLARCLTSLGRKKEADAMYQAATAVMQNQYQGDNLQVAIELISFAITLDKQGEHQLAAGNFEKGFEMLSRLGSDEGLFPAIATCPYANCLKSLGRLDEAIEKYQQGIQLLRKVFPHDNPLLSLAYHEFGRCLSSAGRHKDAIAAYRSGLAVLRRTGDVNTYRTAANLGWLLLQREKNPEEAATMFELAINGAEAARIRVGGEDLDRSQFFAYTEEEFDMFYGMVRAQLELQHPDQGLAWLERGRARALLDVLERGKRLAGEDILQPVRRRAELTNNQRLITEVDQAQTKLSDAAIQVARLHAMIQQARGKSQLDEQARGGEIESLYKELVEAQNHHRQSLRAVFNLAGEHATSDLKPLSAEAIQSMLKGDQRMLVFVVGTYESHVFLVPPPGQPIRAIELRWPGIALVKSQMPDEGVVVTRIVEDSIAAKAGIQPLDVIVSYAGETVTPQELIKATAESDTAADAIPVRVWRDGKQLEITVAGGRLGTYIAAEKPSQWQELAGRGNKVTAATLSETISLYVKQMQQEGKARGLLPVEVQDEDSDSGALGFKLFQTLIPKDIWIEIEAASVVYLVPDGVLNRLPFESLVVHRPEQEQARDQVAAATRRYWLDEGPAIGYGPSATVLVNRSRARDEQLQQQSQGSLPSSLAVALGNPIFQRTADAPPPPPEQGCLVLSSDDGSAAMLAGITTGDVIVEYDGRPVEDDRQLRGLQRDVSDAVEDDTRESKPVELKLWRAGKQVIIQANMGSLGVKVARQSPREAWDMLQTGETKQLGIVTRSGYVSRYGQLTPLPGTEKEVLAIRESLETRRGDLPVITLLQEDATRTQLFSQAGGTRYLHLATHGLVDETDKVCWSSLALTPPVVPTPNDFGFLTLNDLFQNWWGKLAATELVVLSACDSQRGRLSGNEGVFGMPWGFMYAGSPAVIASLWPVDDESTAELMGNLYSEIHTITTDTAITSDAAKLDAFVNVRKSLRQRYPQPYFWAPFVYLGDPR